MRASILALVCAALLGAGGALRAEEAAAPAPDLQRLWSDPAFQKQFLGSFGALSDLEPKLSMTERQQLERVLPLLGSDPAAAEKELAKLATPQASALFDFTLGNLCFQDGRMEPAEKHYETALAKFPAFRRARKNLGLIQVRTGRPAEAVKSLSRVVEQGGGDALTFGLLGSSYNAIGEPISAEAAYRSAILLQPETPEWKQGLIQALLKQQRYAEVAALCEELLTRQPDRSDLWLVQASAYLGMGQPRKAAENFELVDRMGKANLAILNTLGDLHVNEGMWELAGRAYRRALEAGKDQPLDRPLRNVESLAQRGALPEARTLLAAVKERYQSASEEADKKKLLKVEARLAVAEGAGGEAVGVLEEIVALDPLDGDALLLLGAHYARNQDPDRAVFYYERAESLEACEAEARTRHAQILVGQNRYRDAIPLLKRAQELKPRDDVARYLDQVERLARSQ